MNMQILTGNESFSINGNIYNVVIEKDKDDNTYIAKLICEDITDIFLLRCGDTWTEALEELSVAVNDLNFSLNTNNIIVYWNKLTEKQQRKINSKLKTIKMEVIGEWDTMEGHYEHWKRIANNTDIVIGGRNIMINEIYPRLITIGNYNRL